MMQVYPQLTSFQLRTRFSNRTGLPVRRSVQAQKRAHDVTFGWSAANPPVEEDWHCVVDQTNMVEYFKQDENGVWLPKDSLVQQAAEKLEGENSPRFYVIDIKHDAIAGENEAFESLNYFLSKLSEAGVCGVKPHQYIPDNLYPRTDKIYKGVGENPNQVKQENRSTTLRYGDEGVFIARGHSGAGVSQLHRDSIGSSIKIVALLQSPRVNIKNTSALNVFGDFLDWSVDQGISNPVGKVDMFEEYKIGFALAEKHQITLPPPENCYRLILVNNTDEGVMHGVTTPDIIDAEKPALRTSHQIHLSG